uniref:DUF38 domain-containing protein n=1 Tax=Panagrolaimus sp. JU765 TaxID=591449 RepID=A0AC34R5F8_9BILA
MSSPLIRLHFFRTFKFLKRLSKPPKIVQMHSLCFQPKYEPSQVSPELDMNSQDLVYFMYWFLFIEHPDFFTSKFYLSINSSYTKVLYIRMSTKEDVLKSLDLAPNVEELRIQLYDKSIFAEIDDFEHFTKKLGEKLKMRYVLIYNIILPNGWEKSCIKNFMKLSDFQSLHISCLDSETHLPINVVDLHELIVKTNLKISCDRFVGLVKTPEFMEFFKVSEKYESTKFRFNEESYALKCGNEFFILKNLMEVEKFDFLHRFLGPQKLTVASFLPFLIRKHGEWRFEDTSDSVGNCSFFDLIKDQKMKELGRGFNKVVFELPHQNVAIKKISFSGNAFISCMDDADGSFYAEYDCIQSAAYGFITEIGVMLKLQDDPNV